MHCSVQASPRGGDQDRLTDPRLLVSDPPSGTARSLEQLFGIGHGTSGGMVGSPTRAATPCSPVLVVAGRRDPFMRAVRPQLAGREDFRDWLDLVSLSWRMSRHRGREKGGPGPPFSI